MATDKNKKAYIGIERADNSLKYIAKIFNEPPREITKQQYNAIVKALGAQDWRNLDKDETSVINDIIYNQLNPPKVD